MMIDGINSINSINNVQNTNRTSKAGSTSVKSSRDEVTVSDEAKKLADSYYLDKIAKETPDIRADLVAEIKQKIQDPNYLSEARIAAAADKILLSYGL